MLWNDLREYLHRLDELGELETVLGCDWQEEIGGIAELVTEQRGPALLFDEIRDYPKGYRVAVNLFNTPKRTATALGITLEPSIDGVAERFARKLKDFRATPPEEVRDGPVLENIMTGEDVDLFRFPTPKWHENDGGRYIGTGVCVIQKDPDSGFVNSGAYRVAVHDKSHLHHLHRAREARRRDPPQVLGPRREVPGAHLRGTGAGADRPGVVERLPYPRGGVRVRGGGLPPTAAPIRWFGAK